MQAEGGAAGLAVCVKPERFCSTRTRQSLWRLQLHAALNTVALIGLFEVYSVVVVGIPFGKSEVQWTEQQELTVG